VRDGKPPGSSTSGEVIRERARYGRARTNKSSRARGRANQKIQRPREISPRELGRSGKLLTTSTSREVGRVRISTTSRTQPKRARASSETTRQQHPEVFERSSEVRDQTTPSSREVGRNGEDFRSQERSNGAAPTSRKVGRDEENHSTSREVGRTIKTQRRGRTDQHRPHKKSAGTEVQHDLKRSGEP